MPPGGDGFYYFSAYMRTLGGEFANFDIKINGELICSVTADIEDSSSSDREITSCSGATHASEGSTNGYFTVQLTYNNHSHLINIFITASNSSGGKRCFNKHVSFLMSTEERGWLLSMHHRSHDREGSASKGVWAESPPPQTTTGYCQ